MAGIRWLSPPCQAALEPVLPLGPREICADMAASTLTCTVSAPLNSCWVFQATTPKLWTMPLADQAKALGTFLRYQYLDASGTRLSRLAMRDLSVRAVYIAACFSMFSSIERLAVRYWPKK